MSRSLALAVRLLAAGLGYAPMMYEGRQTTSHIEGRPVASHTPYRVDWPESGPGADRSQAWADDGLLWGRVRSVVLDETVVPVYDIEVEEDHSFVADGIVVHNCCQRMELPSTAVGTWEVTYTYGMPPPPGGVLAAGELACNLLLAQSPDTQGLCRLPARVTNIVRQGVSAVILDPMTFFKEGRVGLTLCDYWLMSLREGARRRRATVSSPDIGRRVRDTR